MDDVKLAGDDAALNALASAIKPSVAILDEVVRGGDPAYQIIAQDAKGDLYVNMVVRMRVAEAQLMPWLKQAAASSKEAVRIAKLHPELLTSDPVVTSAAHHSEATMGLGGP
jgi:hypothetical protein